METKNDLFNFEKLNVYNKSLEFIKHIYQITSDFLDSEKYGLISQIRRASLSIALNIAEGCGGSKPQFIKYLNISKGSIRECVVCLAIANNLNYINKDTETKLRMSLIDISKMLSGLILSQKVKN